VRRPAAGFWICFGGSAKTAGRDCRKSGGITEHAVATMLGRAITCIGVLAILHAAFSFVHYKEFMRTAGGATSGSGGLLFELPFDVVVEAGLGFLLCLVGALAGAGKMEPARSTSGLTDTTFDFHMNRADFNLFNHRGAALRARLRSGNA